ncbi:hypothetical protein E0Z10_g4536 [Xylaria hypoxylon]|uniref:Uncharacterized protein n=1 Tax=Xylaria hypoxylon TaxID=37992 RepID=A0A4Z0Z0F3_9PEZI|nr:hypothetical protein E0Z10_g4536 [Xylaria hypoxylon]
MEPYTGPAGSDYSASWVISLPLNAYVTEYVALTDGHEIGGKRLTPMRYRDMMVDNYLDAGGDLKTWTYIGTRSIANMATRDLISNVFHAAGKDVDQPGSVEFLSDSSEFGNVAFGNPFTQGIQGLLREYEEDMGKAKIKRFIFISEGMCKEKDIYVYPLLNLVVELCRPGDEGYPSD